jgi:hypothetical protein
MPAKASFPDPTRFLRATPRLWLRPTDWCAVQFLCLLILLTGRAFEPASAQTMEAPGAGTLLFQSDHGVVEAPRVHTAVNMEVSGVIARVQVRQQFHNAGDRWLEDELLRLIQGELRDSRLFTVGIGSAPNGHFMRKAAQMGRGAFTFIGAATEVDQKMSELVRKLTRVQSRAGVATL